MSEPKRRGAVASVLAETALFVVLAVVLLGATAYLLALALDGADLVALGDLGEPGTGLQRHEALPWLAAIAVAGCLALALWWRDRRRLGEIEDRDHEQLRDAQRRLELAEKFRDTAREWRRELQGMIQHHEAKAGQWGHLDDVPSLVLRTALRLLEAEKGMLFSRQRDGSEGRELIAAEGFEHDPGKSAVARRFCEEVIERDTIVHAGEAELADERQVPADEEIDNLVAIPIYIRDEFNGVVVCINGDSFDQHDEQVLVALGDHAGAILHNAELQGRLRGSYLATVRTLAEAIRAKDGLTSGHAERVSVYVERVARRLELDPERREQLVFASLLHDLGKIGISERILLKAGRLTPEEYGIVQLHPRIGSRLVAQIPDLAPLAPVILHHQERFDGSGYPAGVRGEEIPLEARVICVADAFGAMISDRPYKPRMSPERACAELEANAGTQFDPEVVRLFVAEVRGEPMSETGSDPISRALADPELELRRSGDEPLLGSGPLEITDQLTLLYSHRYFHDLARIEAKRAEVQDAPFMVLLVRLADIGEINRSDGYAAGDRAIQRVARALDGIANRHRGTVARYSGRTLAVLAPQSVEDTAEAVSEALLADLDSGLRVEFGLATWRRGEQGDETIARARSDLAGSAAPLAG